MLVCKHNFMETFKRKPELFTAKNVNKYSYENVAEALQIER